MSSRSPTIIVKIHIVVFHAFRRHSTTWTSFGVALRCFYAYVVATKSLGHLPHSAPYLIPSFRVPKDKPGFNIQVFQEVNMFLGIFPIPGINEDV